jgi:hypothetical protein
MSPDDESPEYHLDAATFQKPLGELANTIALKVQREGRKHLPVPSFVTADIYVLIRQAHQTYDLFFFLNADERRQQDIHWKVAYSAVTLPLIRCMIDCLYNITVILDNPGVKGFQFRESGYRQTLEALNADEQRYGGDPKWDAHIAKRRKGIDFLMRVDGLTKEQVDAAATWPTLSAYLRPSKKKPPTPHQQFLKKLTFGFWHEYSGMAHATFQGLMGTAMFYTRDDIPREDRPMFEVVSDQMIAIHISRVAAILICIITEVQAYFRFDGARINQRLHGVWNALLPVLEIKELYDERYAQLMKDRGINP